ncbi:hypothetical protein [Hyalangium versicolor]|uniref:hypothetical protein n=1 Tax=Hyalangium versicolor TaxID=2861190 RepID=UPI001CCCB1D7|nr:hypothetical protein [Hyalangium versicolor]
MNPRVCPMRGRVDEHFARKLKPASEHALREHLPACTSCKSLYERHLLLRRLDPKANADAQRRLGQGLGLVRPPVPVTQGVAALAVVALLVVGVVATRPTPFSTEAEGFTARGNPAAAQPDNLRVFRVRPGQTAEPVEGELRAGDELAFAYENPHGRKWLMIYAVDEHQHVYWFHPSWSDPDSNPAAVQAFGGVALHELPEAISHDFDGERLVLHGVLADERLTVKQVEALMRGHTPEQPLSLRGAEETSFTVKVKR